MYKYTFSSPTNNEQLATISYIPSIGSPINLGSHVLPWTYEAENISGTFEMYFEQTQETCVIEIPELPCDTCMSDYLPFPGNSITYSNGLTISATGSACIEPMPYPRYEVTRCGLWYIPYGVQLCEFSPFTYTLNFSTPVNDFYLVLLGYNSTESFTFTTDTGSGIPELVSCKMCCTVIDGNTIYPTVRGALQDPGLYTYIGCDDIIGVASIKVRNSIPYNSLTISGPGGPGGTVINICMSGPEMTTTTSTTTTQFPSNNTIYMTFSTY